MKIQSPKPGKMATACRHPKVRIVSRHDDTEFVECLECGEIFDSEEFRDMEIEDTVETEDVSDALAVAICHATLTGSPARRVLGGAQLGVTR